MTTAELKEALAPINISVNTYAYTASVNVDIYDGGAQLATIPRRMYRYTLYAAFDKLEPTIQLHVIDLIAEYVKTPTGGR